MKVYELLNLANMEEQKKLIEIQDSRISKETWINFIQMVSKLNHKDSKENLIIFNFVEDKDFGSYYEPILFHVTELKKYLESIKDMECPVKEYDKQGSNTYLKNLCDKFPDTPQTFSFEFEPWTNILGYEVYEGNLNEFGVQNCICALLYEMSFHGFSEEAKEKSLQDLINSSKGPFISQNELDKISEEELNKLLDACEVKDGEQIFLKCMKNNRNHLLSKYEIQAILEDNKGMSFDDFKERCLKHWKEKEEDRRLNMVECLECEIRGFDFFKSMVYTKERIYSLLLSDGFALETLYKQRRLKDIDIRLNDLFECEQNNPHHFANVGRHTCFALDYALKHLNGFTEFEKETLLVALMLHDIGKPDCKFTDDTGDHFYGHPLRSVEIAKDFLKKYDYSKEETERILLLVRFHDENFSLKQRTLRKILIVEHLYPEVMKSLFLLKRADANAHVDASVMLERVDTFESYYYKEVQNKIYKPEQLKVKVPKELEVDALTLCFYSPEKNTDVDLEKFINNNKKKVY